MKEELVANEHSILTFRLDGQMYALPVEAVAQIVPMVRIMPLPQFGRPVEGMIDVRGRPVPVVDLRGYLLGREAPLLADTPIVLARIGPWMAGLIVDEVVAVLGLSAGEILPAGNLLPAGIACPRVLHGLAHATGGLVLVLDPLCLFAPGQAEALAEAAAALYAAEGDCA